MKGIHVFWTIAAFFAVVIAVDVFFIVSAIATFPGEQVKNAYVLGLDYNREAARREKQAALGWTAQAGVRDEDGQVLVVRLEDKHHRPVGGLTMAAEIFASGAAKDSWSLLLVERAPGEYAAELPFDRARRLEMTIAAGRPGENEVVFEAGKVVAP